MCCGERKPLEDFYRHAKTRDGRQSRCKACDRRRLQHRYLEERTSPRPYRPHRARSVSRHARERARTCAYKYCGAPFTAARKDARFCSDDCAKRANGGHLPRRVQRSQRLAQRAPDDFIQIGVKLEVRLVREVDAAADAAGLSRTEFVRRMLRRAFQLTLAANE